MAPSQQDREGRPENSLTAPLHSNGTPTSAEGLESSQSLEVVGRNMKELVDAINAMKDLSRLGIERSHIPIPKVIVVGDQSAGKSSLIEAMSEIRVPRATGTCTMCPIQITTSAENGRWECNVSIVQNFTIWPHDDIRAKKSQGHHIPFAPWVESNTDTIPFARIHDKNDLEDVLKRAQIGILHPSQDPRQFISGPIPKTLEQEFSPNHISVEIKGPGLPSLSFFDLPGVITSTEHNDKKYLIQVVRELVKSYIKDENSLILLACPMEGDMMNSKAFSIVGDLKAADRCIGVLTKPDRLPEGDPTNIWGAILAGDKYSVGHGWYATKQPAQVDLGCTHAQAREAEAEFFATRSPWNSEFVEFSDKFGTRALQSALSQKLVDQIRMCLPDMYQKINNKIAELNVELSQYPETPKAQAIHNVLTSVNDFTRLIEQLMQGMHPHNEFRKHWKNLKQSFSAGLRHLRPRVIPTSKQDEKLKVVAKTTFTSKASPQKRFLTEEVTDLESDESTPCPIPTNKRQKTSQGMAKPASSGTSSGISSDLMGELHSKDYYPQSFEKMCSLYLDLAKKYTLDEVQEKLDNFSTSGRHGVVDPAAVDHLILESLKDWNVPTENLVQRVSELLEQRLGDTVHAALKQWENTELYKSVWKVTSALLGVCLDAHRKVADKILTYEQYTQPSTGNQEACDRERQAVLNEIREHRLQKRARTLLAAEMVLQGIAPSGQEIESKLVAEKKRLEAVLSQHPDPADREIQVIADIRGYYSIASARYADMICRSFEIEVFETLKQNLGKEISAQILAPKDDGMEFQDRCEMLLATDGERARKRMELLGEIGKLNSAKAILDGLESKYSMVTVPKVEAHDGDDDEILNFLMELS